MKNNKISADSVLTAAVIATVIGIVAVTILYVRGHGDVEIIENIPHEMDDKQ